MQTMKWDGTDALMIPEEETTLEEDTPCDICDLSNTRQLYRVVHLI